MPMATKLGRVVACLEELLPIELLDLWSSGRSGSFIIFNIFKLLLHLLYSNYYISTTTVPTVTKLYRMLIYYDRFLSLKSLGHVTLCLHYHNTYGHLNEGLSLIKSHDPLVTWSCEIVWPAKIILSPLSQCLLTLNFAEWWLRMTDCHPRSHMTLWSRGSVRLCDKLNPLYLH